VSTDNGRTDRRPGNIMPPPLVVGGGIETTIMSRNGSTGKGDWKKRFIRININL